MALNEYVTVLASGGLDSTACIHFYKKLGFEVEALFIDYNQPALEKERNAIRLISQHYSVRLKTAKIENAFNLSSNGEIIGRNALFLTTALMQFPKSYGLICLGIHSGLSYYDCSHEFIKSMQNVFNGYTDRTLKISVPFMNFNKLEIYNYCLTENVPIELTYSCEKGRDNPCGECATCKDLELICTEFKK